MNKIEKVEGVALPVNGILLQRSLPQCTELVFSSKEPSGCSASEMNYLI